MYPIFLYIVPLGTVCTVFIHCCALVQADIKRATKPGSQQRSSRDRMKLVRFFLNVESSIAGRLPRGPRWVVPSQLIPCPN